MNPRILVAAIFVLASCGGNSNERDETKKVTEPPIGKGDGAHRIAQLVGLHGPESVRYDPELDVFYVSNMTGYGSDKDGNGYIVRVPANDFSKATILVDGGTGKVVLDSPKGLALHGDTLWAADIDVLRAFDRRTGAPLANIDLSSQGAVMLNDVAIDGDGRIYVTDTGILMTDKGVLHPGGDKIFAIGPGGAVSVIAQGNQLDRPNGITWDAKNNRLVVVSFDPFHSTVYALAANNAKSSVLANGKGKFDGIELLDDGRMLVSSWADSSVHAFKGDDDRRVAIGVLTPADIGVDTKRHRIAVPSSMMNRVELWELENRD